MQVDEITQRHAAQWWEEGDAADWGPAYSAAQQSGHEAKLGQFQERVSAEAECPPHTAAEQAATQERILAALQPLAQALGIAQPIGLLLHSGMVETAKTFARMARRFDPAISGSDIYQAIRNMWTMNGLQILLGMPVAVTPSVFAYSLLYPYSDNYLDDPAVSEGQKVAFNERFGQRLQGNQVAPAHATERAIFELVGMIENQYDRRAQPDVFGSLLAIHRAQERSVRLLRRIAPPYEVDVLGISLEKGGASVLADGYLVAGTLTAPQAAFAFGLGAFLQLVDDLQDVEADRQAGLLTVFSHAAGRWPLDSLTDRALRFGRRVLAGLERWEGPNVAALRELIHLSTVQLLLQAAGSASRYHTREYLQSLEPHSPFRFAFLRRQRRKTAGRYPMLMRLLEIFAQGTEDQGQPSASVVQ